MKSFYSGCICVVLSLVTVVAGNVAQANEREPVRGVVKSLHEAVLSVDINARVLQTPVRTGDTFAKDDVLIEFDCEVQKAEAKAARASYTASKSAHNSNLELNQYGAIGEFEVGVSKAEMLRAGAVAEAASARTKDCVINAPFAGRVADLSINTFETPGPNQPLIKIVSSEDFEINLIVPSNWLAWIRAGTEFEFVVDETGERKKAAVWQIGAEVDAVSKTVPVIARFSVIPAAVLPGMSGTAYF